MRLLVLLLLICFTINRSKLLQAQDASGGIVCGVEAQFDSISTVQIKADPSNEAEPTRGTNSEANIAPITLTLIDKSSATSPFVLSVWTKPGIDTSTLRLVVVAQNDLLVDVLQAKIQTSMADDGQLVTFVGQLTKDCLPTFRINVIRVLTDSLFPNPLPENDGQPKIARENAS